jgi:hypothetical protein
MKYTSKIKRRKEPIEYRRFLSVDTNSISALRKPAGPDNDQAHRSDDSQYLTEGDPWSWPPSLRRDRSE